MVHSTATAAVALAVAAAGGGAVVKAALTPVTSRPLAPHDDYMALQLQPASTRGGNDPVAAPLSLRSASVNTSGEPAWQQTACLSKDVYYVLLNTAVLAHDAGTAANLTARTQRGCARVPQRTRTEGRADGSERLCVPLAPACVACSQHRSGV